MADLAVHDGWVSLGDVSRRQGISRKYLEQVASPLLKAGYIEGRRGKGGGYRLTREPGATPWARLLRAGAEGTRRARELPSTAATGELCPRAEECATMPVWRDLGALTSSYLDGKHLSDILEPAGADADDATDDRTVDGSGAPRDAE